MSCSQYVLNKQFLYSTYYNSIHIKSFSNDCIVEQESNNKQSNIFIYPSRPKKGPCDHWTHPSTCRRCHTKAPHRHEQTLRTATTGIVSRTGDSRGGWEMISDASFTNHQRVSPSRILLAPIHDIFLLCITLHHKHCYRIKS
jgi:hypothetical protein